MNILDLTQEQFRQLVLAQEQLRKEGKPDLTIQESLDIDHNDLYLIDRILSLEPNSLQAVRPQA